MSAIRRFVSKVVPPVGPYSSAVLVNGTLYVSGCIGIDASGKLTSNNVEGQAKQALENMREILTIGGATFNDVVKTTILLRDMNDFATVNAAYAKVFEEGKFPARSTFAVAGLPKDALVEIEAIAVPSGQPQQE